MPFDINKEQFLLVRVYGDSLSMPRGFDGIPFYCTYPEILRQALELIWPGKRICLYNRSLGGSTVQSLWLNYNSDNSYFGPTKGDILIIQCGIVDCAPRPVPDFMRKSISRLPKSMHYAVTNFLHKYRPNILRAGFSWRRNMPEDFKSTLIQWLIASKEEFDRIYVINIAPTNEEIELHSPGLNASIKLFNKLIFESIKSVFSEKVYLVDVYEMICRSATDLSTFINARDGHHITLEGHKLYAQMIEELEILRSKGL